MKRLILSILAVALGLSLALFSQDRKPSVPSQRTQGTTFSQAPEFSLTDLSGRRIDLATYRGHVVVLNFWATWCAPCRAEIPEFVDLQKKYGNQGLQILGISLDDEAGPVRDFYRQFKINYPVAIGDAGLAERYGGILGLPVSFVIDCDGKIQARYTGKADEIQLEDEVKPLLKAPSCTEKRL